jgi:hypothetical protein
MLAIRDAPGGSLRIRRNTDLHRDGRGGVEGGPVCPEPPLKAVCLNERQSFGCCRKAYFDAIQLPENANTGRRRDLPLRLGA